jgi:hypothetical protein
MRFFWSLEREEGGIIGLVVVEEVLVEEIVVEGNMMMMVMLLLWYSCCSIYGYGSAFSLLLVLSVRSVILFLLPTTKI